MGGVFSVVCLGVSDPSEQMMLQIPLFFCKPDDSLVKNSFADLNNRTKQNLPPTNPCLFGVFFSLSCKFTADIGLGIGWLPNTVVPQKCTESIFQSPIKKNMEQQCQEKKCVKQHMNFFRVNICKT